MNILDYSDVTLKEGVEFKDILLHSPYENLLNCGLKEDNFWKYLLYADQEYKSVANGIFKCLAHNEESRSFIFLKGFSGCGKTTFVRWLIKSALFETEMLIGKDVHRQYINLSFNTITEEINNDNDNEKRTNSDGEIIQNQVYLNETIIQIIKREFDEYKSTFEFILANFDFIESQIRGLDEKEDVLFEVTNAETNSVFRKKFAEFTKGLPTTTLLIICFLQKIIRTKEKKKRVCFFCIDNLDSLNYSYLVKGFWEDFLFAYNKTSKIVDEVLDTTIDIKKRLKFLFVVREHHYYLIKANLNPHKYAVMNGSLTKFSLTQPNLKGILEKRINLAKKKQLDVNSRIMSLVDIIVNEDLLYREKFYLPLFNYDLRKLNQKIVEIILQSDLVHFDFDFVTYQKLYDFKTYNQKTDKNEFPYRNGARGILIHSFLKILFQSDEKYPIEPIFDDPPIYPDNFPFCSYCRLLLTLIYNLTCTRTNRLDKNLENLGTIITNDFTLDDLIRQLRIYKDSPNKPLIPIEHVFSWLRHFYTLGNETITHLINISGKITSKSKRFSFDQEIEAAQNVKTSDLYDTSLNDLMIRINPSGVVYLRYLIPHFEFFANYKYWRSDKFEKQFKPLYLSTEVIEAPSKQKTHYRYEFEVLLEDVFKLVKRKKNQNDSFLNMRIFNNSNFGTLSDYLRSNFVVHFRETPDLLYSTRLITTHLTYIDQFRRFITEDADFNNLIRENTKKYGTKTKRRIKEFILEIQMKYVDLYFENQRSRILDTSVTNLMHRWRHHIQQLLVGNHSDFHSLDYQRNLYPEL